MAKKQHQSYFVYLEAALNKYEGDSLFFAHINKELLNVLDYVFNSPFVILEERITLDVNKIKALFVNPFFKIIFYGLIYESNRDFFPTLNPMKKLAQAFCQYEDHPLYHFALGLVYEKGLGVNKDTEKAYNYYHEGASSGCPFSLYTITNMIINYELTYNKTQTKLDRDILFNLEMVEKQGLAVGAMRYATYLMHHLNYEKYHDTIFKKLYAASTLAQSSPALLLSMHALLFLHEYMVNEDIPDEELAPYLPLSVLNNSSEGYYFHYLFYKRRLSDPLELYFKTVEPLILAAHYGKKEAHAALAFFYLNVEPIKNKELGMYHETHAKE